MKKITKKQRVKLSEDIGTDIYTARIGLCNACNSINSYLEADLSADRRALCVHLKEVLAGLRERIISIERNYQSET